MEEYIYVNLNKRKNKKLYHKDITSKVINLELEKPI